MCELQKNKIVKECNSCLCQHTTNPVCQPTDSDISFMGSYVQKCWNCGQYLYGGKP